MNFHLNEIRNIKAPVWWHRAQQLVCSMSAFQADTSVGVGVPVFLELVVGGFLWVLWLHPCFHQLVVLANR